MEKEGFFNWQPTTAQQPPELNSGYFNLNWDNQSVDQSAHFESALSSLVSSPSSNPPANPAESVVIKELIGRLGSICNSGEISPPSHYQSTANSSYSTPLNSPPKLNLGMMDHQLGRVGVPIRGNSATLAPFAADPGFAERAARFSCFGTRNYGGGGMSRVSSSQSLKAAAAAAAAAGSQIGLAEASREMNGVQLESEMRPRFNGRATPEDGEESSASDKMAGSEGSGRKRKAPPKGRGKEANLPSSKVAEDDDSNAKRCRSAEANGAEKDDAVKPKAEESNGAGGEKKGKEGNAKPPEPPKQDYIHVRARRGQATDSHSLAERVRREKISERMKFLQDLVPGCNKVTGKAVMLDEIINYVQSLQRQVEFLSMKLATVNPRLDFNIDSLIQKDMHQSRGPLPPHSVYPLETASSAAFSYGNQPTQGASLQGLMSNGLESQCSVNPLDVALRRGLSMQLPSLDGFGDAATQLGAFWEDDLQSVVQMGFGQSQEAVFSSQSFQGSMPTSHMKIEL